MLFFLDLSRLLLGWIVNLWLYDSNHFQCFTECIVEYLLVRVDHLDEHLVRNGLRINLVYISALLLHAEDVWCDCYGYVVGCHLVGGLEVRDVLEELDQELQNVFVQRGERQYDLPYACSADFGALSDEVFILRLGDQR